MSASERKRKWTQKIKETNKRCYYKFDIGDKGWFMDDSKIRREPVVEIERQKNTPDNYLVAGLWKRDHQLFQTKQALTNSLFIEHEEYYKKKDIK